jgi:starch phosphorylase
MIADGGLYPHDSSLFRPLTDSLLYRDVFMVLADYDAYVRCQENVDRKFLDPDDWHRMSILNVARMGRFSSDRSIFEYCRDIWHVGPVDVSL